MQLLLGLLGGDPAREAALAAVGSPAPLLVCTGFPVGRQTRDRRTTRRHRAGWTHFSPLARPCGSLPFPPFSMRQRGAAQYERSAAPVGVGARCRSAEQRQRHHDRSRAVNAVTASIATCMVTTSATRRRASNSLIGRRALISVGDGGNEFGMGAAPEEFFARWKVTPAPVGCRCACPCFGFQLWRLCHHS